MSQVFSYAIATGLIEANPTAEMRAVTEKLGPHTPPPVPTLQRNAERHGGDPRLRIRSPTENGVHVNDLHGLKPRRGAARQMVGDRP
ncbi:hypothetical protein [Pseudomonas sp. URMO17WK12:I12]|uniref:hypothetical protein n=1 Tax=Pseudomonas sp. URMO17WK12:I12 TaxID=1259797 RepID=UPI00210BF833|nr:hypothetical protein [Pseudomonas sp. URMO17WK12:I12]